MGSENIEKRPERVLANKELIALSLFHLIVVLISFSDVEKKAACFLYYLRNTGNTLYILKN